MKVLRYELGPRLAIGGMAEVFLATASLDVRAGGERIEGPPTRMVVLKRILPTHSRDPMFV